MLESVIASPEVVHYICKRFDIKMSKKLGKEDEKKIYHILDNDNGIIFNADRLLRQWTKR